MIPMKRLFVDKYGPADVRALEQIEVYLGRQAPEPYRAWLLETNGGVPENRSLDIGAQCVPVKCFDPIKPELEWDISHTLDIMKGRLPDGCMPIASESFGGVVLLDIAFKKYGTIYYFDSIDGFPWELDELDWSLWHEVAPSFEEFCNLLKPITP